VTELLPEGETLKKFVDAIFKHCDRRGVVALRAFHDGKTVADPFIKEPITLGDPQFDVVLSERVRQAAAWPVPAVFAPPVATFKTGKNAKVENILEAPALSVDCDQCPARARARLTRLLGDPTVTVASGGEWTNPDTGEVEDKMHLHWRFKKPARTRAELALAREAREIATRIADGDGTGVALVHPFRWPGSWHRKAAPRLARIVHSTDNEIDLEEAVAMLRNVADGDDDDPPDGGGNLKASNPADVAAALEIIPNADVDWCAWNIVGMATWASTEGSEEGFEAFATWSAKSAKNDPDATRARWDHYKKSPPTRGGFGTLVYMARQHKPWFSPAGEKPTEATEVVEPVDLWTRAAPPGIPRSVLPDVIERFACEQARAMGADPTGLAMAALAVCAAAIPDRIKLQPKRHERDWLESARIWVAEVGPPSTAKTPTISRATQPLCRINAEMVRQYVEKRAEYDALDKAERATTAPPKDVRMVLQDTTIEAAQEVFRDTVEGVLCLHDELSGFFGAMDKYAGGARASAKDRAFWLQAYNGGPYTVNRVGRGSAYLPNLSVSVLGGIQPEAMREIARSSVDDGLVQRLIPVMLKPAVLGADEEMSDAAADYGSLIGQLRNLNCPVFGPKLRFDDKAQEYFRELEQRHIHLQDYGRISRKLAAHFGKYSGIFARLCVVFHCVENASGNLPHIIPEETARRVGMLLHGVLFHHALAFYTETLEQIDGHDELLAVAGYILRHKPDHVSRRTINRNVRQTRKLDRRAADALFDRLDAHGWTWLIDDPTKKAPRRAVNPLVHERFAERARDEAEQSARLRKLIAEEVARRGGGLE
jgi:hypothetical protein